MMSAPQGREEGVEAQREETSGHRAQGEEAERETLIGCRRHVTAEEEGEIGEE